MIKVESKTKTKKYVQENIANPIIIKLNEFQNNIDLLDIRYASQKGAFILFGNKIEGDIILDELNLNMSHPKRIINAKDKYKKLLLLSLKDEINYVTIYPDDTQSLKIASVFQIYLTLFDNDISFIVDYLYHTQEYLPIKYFFNSFKQFKGRNGNVSSELVVFLKKIHDTFYKKNLLILKHAFFHIFSDLCKYIDQVEEYADDQAGLYDDIFDSLIAA